MKLQNKILFILFLFLSVLLFFNINNVFAAISFTYNGEQVDLPDLPSDVNISYGYVVGSFNNATSDTTDDYYRILILSNSDSYFYLIGGQYYVSGSASMYSYKNNNWSFDKNTTDYIINGHLRYVYSTVNVYSDIDKTEVFFRPVLEVVIPALETAEQIPQVIVKTLKILIPVGLIVLAIGLTIYLIKRVIYLTQ